MSVDDYIIGLLLFLYGTIDPETLQTLAILPDLQQLINTIRSNFNTSIHSSCDVSSNEPLPENGLKTVDITPSDKFPERYRTLMLKNNNMLTNILNALPNGISDATIARWIIDAAPFT